MAKFDEKAVHAICTAYGNYRAAITLAGCDDSGQSDHFVIHTGKALLALQDYMGIEVADMKRVKEAVAFAREQVEAA